MPRITKKDIIHEATEIKKFIEKNKKLPKYCTINNNQYSVYTTAYLISRTIANLKADSFNVKPISKSNQGFSVKLNENCSKTTYLDMVSRFNEYCSRNNRVPSYVVTIRNKADFTTFLYGLCKILNYYKNNKVLPNSCLFTSSYIDVNKKEATKTKTEASKSTSHTKKTNTCSNPYTSSPNLPESERGQNTSYGCANNGEQEALYKLTGKIFKESELAKLSGTTTSGTDHSGINTCIAAIAKKLGIKLTVKWVNFSSLGKTVDERFEALGKIICQSNKAVITHIAYMNGGEDLFNKNGVWYGHYEPIKEINTKTKNVKVLNSLGYKKANGGYKGRIQDRSFKVEASYLANTPGGQPAICIITKG